MKKCINCGKEYDDDKVFCPACGMKLTEVPSASESNTPPASESSPLPIPAPTKESDKQSKRLVVILSILAFAAVFAAICLSFIVYDYSERLGNVQRSLSSSKYELEQAEKELEQAKGETEQLQLDLEQARNDIVEAQMDLEKLGGLQELYGYGSENYYAEESVVVLREYESKDITICININATAYASSSGTGISFKWSRNWRSLPPQPNKAAMAATKATITGNSAGYYTVKFTNDENSDSFEILVIVTE